MSLISNPHTVQRYFTFNLRISPAGGGGGGGAPIVRRKPIPVFHRSHPTNTPAATQITGEKAGMASGYRGLANPAAQVNGIVRLVSSAVNTPLRVRVPSAADEKSL